MSAYDLSKIQISQPHLYAARVRLGSWPPGWLSDWFIRHGLRTAMLVHIVCIGNPQGYLGTAEIVRDEKGVVAWLHQMSAAVPGSLRNEFTHECRLQMAALGREYSPYSW